MVGLRWWSAIKDDGSEEWIYESLDTSMLYHFKIYKYFIDAKNAADSRVFWMTSYAAPVLWIILAVVSVFSFSIQNVTICIIGFLLSSTNLVGY